MLAVSNQPLDGTDWIMAVGCLIALGWFVYEMFRLVVAHISTRTEETNEPITRACRNDSSMDHRGTDSVPLCGMVDDTLMTTSQITTLEEYDAVMADLGKAAWAARLKVKEAQRAEDEIMDQMLKLRIRRLEGEFK